MTFYGNMQAVAADMLDLVANDGFGQVVTVTQPESGGTYDPSTGGVTGASATSETGSGAVFDYPISLRSRGGQGDAPNALILQGDRNLLLSPNKSDGTLLTTPQANWTVTIDGVTWTLMSVAPLSPAGVIVYYDCQIRRS